MQSIEDEPIVDEAELQLKRDKCLEKYMTLLEKFDESITSEKSFVEKWTGHFGAYGMHELDEFEKELIQYEKIIRRTDGNPLILTELRRQLIETLAEEAVEKIKDLQLKRDGCLKQFTSFIERLKESKAEESIVENYRFKLASYDSHQLDTCKKIHIQWEPILEQEENWRRGEPERLRQLQEYYAKAQEEAEEKRRNTLRYKTTAFFKGIFKK
ncbi:hypothetical protein CRE_01137 [Caenorhabditis remanei]|uniref:Uncharacterized protein n=1 Tax=Caenorhabditis remanei TaxID=31234 RepID=E3MWD8_CAERE|nr:hypothetical protein CRE_01137 [Caenorhabditis remanei]